MAKKGESERRRKGFMESKTIHQITPGELRTFMSRHRESDYLLLDVRQPEEYTEAHIPGAKLIPLPELEDRLGEVSGNRDVVFYCRSGKRSRAGAMFASDADHVGGALYNLTGGITAWNGETLSEFPNVRVFEQAQSREELLLQAMDLEKGAWRFYQTLLGRFGSEPYSHVFELLAKEEEAHARLIHHHLQKAGRVQPAFGEAFEGLEGGLLESGESLEDAVERMEDLDGDRCLHLMEMSLNVEYAAYDLHRTIAEQSEEEETREAFWSIAQAEKGHMRTITKAIRMCGG